MNQPQEPNKSISLADKLSSLLRFPTVSSYDPRQEDESAFRGVVDSLPGLFPRVGAALECIRIGPRALLYSWKGSEEHLPPAILCAHFDVVPAPDPGSWANPPFSGAIADGCVWGRGAQDIKVLMASILEAAERLLAEGFSPRRTVYFAFGGDEEVGGRRGAREIASFLKARGVRASVLLDEGGPIALKMLSFAQRPLALVGVAEKGYMDVQLKAKAKGGHASMPPAKTAPGNLARALADLESHPSPARMTKTIREFLSALAKEAQQPYKLLFKNLWLTAPLVLSAFASSPATNALIRTTRAITMLQGSPKENVLADAAEATVNVRILPGESADSALDRIRRRAERFGVSAEIKHPGQEVEASGESSAAGEGFAAIRKALASSHPEAACLPFLFSAGTDTKHYAEVAQDLYRFTCLPQTSEDLKGVHGRDERVRIVDLERCAAFYGTLMAAL